MALVLGEEKRAYPIPNRTNMALMKKMLVLTPIKAIINNPAEIKAMPAEAIFPGSSLSDNFPVKGEKTAINKG